MLAGSIIANPQPSATNCTAGGKSPRSSICGNANGVCRSGSYAGCLSNTSFNDGSFSIIIAFNAAFIFENSSCDGSFGAGNFAGANIISTGTGPFALTGVTSIIDTSTLMAGYAELSTCPTSFFAITGVKPTNSWSVAATVHVTFGTFFG